MNNFIVDLNHLDLMAVKGPGSGKFLQGQLTCDVDAVTDARLVAGAACNNKGRVLFSFTLVKRDMDYYLEMEPALLETAKAHLDKYIVFYQAQTMDARAEFERIGVAGERAESLLSRMFPRLPDDEVEVVQYGGSLLIDLNDSTWGHGWLPRYELWIQPADAKEVWDQLAASLPVADYSHWQMQDFRRGIYRVQAPDSGEYTPQALSYDLWGLVNFYKGCYTGQEIVARMHYRGSAKKRLHPIRLHSSEPPAQLEGRPLVAHGTGEKAGEILRLVPAGETAREGLAFIDVPHLKAGTPLALEGASATPVEVLMLPYPPDY